MNLEVLRSALHTAAAFGHSVAAVVADFKNGQAAAAAGDFISALPFFIPFLAGLILVFAIRRKWKPFLLALLCLLLYGGMEYISEKGMAGGAGAAAILLGRTALILALTMFLFLFLYGMFHRRSRRRDIEDYDVDYIDENDGESYYEDLSQQDDYSQPEDLPQQ
ncbi:MAG: hypothetical protein IKD85_00290 [Firmicutes bacterium]|nr:hypothetical protein [Bacillota bacterium]